MGRARGGAAAIVAAAVLAGGLTGCRPRQPWQPALISINLAGTDAGAGSSTDPAFSPDGTMIAFESAADDLVAVDAPPAPGTDVFVRDLRSGVTSLVSMNAAGTGGGNRHSGDPSFSADGTKVAFVSFADDLGPQDSWRPLPIGPPFESLFAGDIYLRDLVAGTTSLVSTNAEGTDSANFLSDAPVFSPDGSKVAFRSWATNMGPPDGDSLDTGFLTGSDVYVRDLETGTTVLASANAAGTSSGNGSSYFPVFSPDGTKLAFTSAADDLGPVDSSRGPTEEQNLDLYVRDLAAGTTSLVTANAAGTDSSGGMQQYERSVFSPDSTSIAFHSWSTDLAEVDTNGKSDVFVRDLASATTRLVSVDAGGTDSASGESFDPAFSPDGTTIAFSSAAADFGPPDSESVSGGGHDIYARNLTTGVTSLVSVRANGSGNGGPQNGAFYPRFSPDGTKVAFGSDASDFGPRDEPRAGYDIYVRDLVTGTTTLVTSNVAGTNSTNNTVVTPLWNPDGRSIAFVTDRNYGLPDTNNLFDIYVATLRGADLTITGKARPERVRTGDELVYHLVETNRGPDQSTDAAVALLLPESVSYVVATSSSGTCTPPNPEPPRVVVCDFGDLPVGESAKAKVTVTVDAAAGETLSALAAVLTQGIDPAQNNNVVAIESVVDA